MDEKLDAAAEIRRSAPVLAGALERFGCDSVGVLTVAHFADGFGGPAAILPTWERNKVSLQRALIRLRNGEPESNRAAVVTAESDGAPHEANQPGESAAPPRSAHSKQSTATEIPARARKAGEQYRAAAESLGGEPTDREAYNMYADKLSSSGESGELPTFDSWQRNLRDYRRLTGTQKNKPRAGRSGASTVRSADLAPGELPTSALPRGGRSNP